MTDFRDIRLTLDDLASDPDWQTETDTNLPVLTPVEPPSLTRTCGRIFACACGTGGGAALSHLGCAASHILSFSPAFLNLGLSASGTGVALALAGGTAGGAAWYGLYGRTAKKWEKYAAGGGIACGAVLSIALHFNGVAGDLSKADAAQSYYRNMTQEEQRTVQERTGPRTLYQMLMDLCATPPSPK